MIKLKILFQLPLFMWSNLTKAVDPSFPIVHDTTQWHLSEIMPPKNILQVSLFDLVQKRRSHHAVYSSCMEIGWLVDAVLNP